MQKYNVVIVIPCFNEATGVAKVIQGFPYKQLLHHGYEVEIVVVDNNSSDDTASVARSAGARVISEKKKGKGNAMRTGFKGIHRDTDFVVMLDGDDTYNPTEIIRMLEPLRNDFCEVVVGSRLLGKMKADSMTLFNRIGNSIFSHLVKYIYGVNVTDALTGYFAWKKEVIDELAPHLLSNDFAIEMEMITKMARLGYGIYSVPISYHPRKGESSLHPIYDGCRILIMFLRNLFWKSETGSVVEELEIVG